MIRFLSFSLLGLLFFSACKTGEEAPTLIHVEAFTGIPLNKVDHVEIIINDVESLGAYPVPGTIPVLNHNGETGSITLRAGIQENGIASTPTLYPFFKSYRTAVTFEAGKEITVTPELAYTDDAQIDPATFAVFENQSNCYTFPDQDPEISGQVFLNLGQADNGNPAAFIEMEYRTTVDLRVGLVGVRDGLDGSSAFPFGINPNGEWNKIYLNITPDLLETDYNEFRVTMSPIAAGEVCVRSVKVIHFAP